MEIFEIKSDGNIEKKKKKGGYKSFSNPNPNNDFMTLKTQRAITPKKKKKKKKDKKT